MVQSTQEDQMDYCSSCRRHLNGALACPGCGAYAPDIAPPAHLYATTGVAAAAWDEAPTWHDAGLHEEPAAGSDPAEVPADDVTDAPVAPEGRAARRRQRARWRKNQRKAVVATAVALVGGGLTVSAMNQQSNVRTQAATSPDNRSMGVAELPTSDDALPASTPAKAQQASTTTPSKSVASHRRTGDAASTRSSVHTDSAVSPTPTATTASQSKSHATLSTSVAAGADTGGTTGTSGTTGTTTEQTPSSTATDTTTTTNTGTSSNSSQTSETSTSSSSATDPSGLCVLNLLCIN
ncbi:hypothetical protein OOK27_06915 [Streptomyces canus]|uniref:SCO2400 family protein n=1 Tax=Streptomyces canus TaxID=58343 RepID=UPI002257BE71|nr:hypothetical protein [Streptomyces canus]MCX5253904.1 hypothetical protein [Streptomyces canus]